MALPTIVNGQECPTEIVKILQALIDEKATVSLNNLNATGEQRFTTINNNISSLQSALSSLTTTVNGKISASVKKAANGYIKFSNGLIIQWLRFSQSANSEKHNLVISFSSASSYVTMLTQTATSDTDSNIAVSAQTTSSFTCYAQSSERAKAIYAIAVGY